MVQEEGETRGGFGSEKERREGGIWRVDRGLTPYFYLKWGWVCFGLWEENGPRFRIGFIFLGYINN